MYLLSFLYCRMPVTLAVGQKNPTVSIRHHKEVRLESPITQWTVYNKYKNKHDNNHNHRTYNTSTSHKDYSTYIHTTYHISRPLISRSDSSETGGLSSVMEDIRKLSNGELLEAITLPKPVNFFLNQPQKQNNMLFPSKSYTVTIKITTEE